MDNNFAIPIAESGLTNNVNWLPVVRSRSNISSLKTYNYDVDFHSPLSPSISQNSFEQNSVTSIWNICNIRQVKGWDGYDASPISSEASYYAIAFVKLISKNQLPLPDIFPEPTGNIGFQWENSKINLILSFNAQGQIIFAKSANEEGYSYGVHNFLHKKISDEILSLIHSLDD